jgi:hypothetical protein
LDFSIQPWENRAITAETIVTDREFFNHLVQGADESLGPFVRLLEERAIPFCVIGGLAVNAYADPVVSLDFDVVIVADRVDDLVAAVAGMFAVERFANSVNLSPGGGQIRIQLQTDPRYQPFVGRASRRRVLGFDLPVAAIEDVLQGKVWAATDQSRRPSKRQKDLADIMRLVESDAALIARLPAELKARLYPEG